MLKFQSSFSSFPPRPTIRFSCGKIPNEPKSPANLITQMRRQNFVQSKVFQPTSHTYVSPDSGSNTSVNPEFRSSDTRFLPRKRSTIFFIKWKCWEAVTNCLEEIKRVKSSESNHFLKVVSFEKETLPDAKRNILNIWMCVLNRLCFAKIRVPFFKDLTYLFSFKGKVSTIIKLQQMLTKFSICLSKMPLTSKLKFTV